ncbi:MAG: PQQ-binding-like beta-propeller repeat protein, partial [Opitutaceae bacterium]
RFVNGAPPTGSPADDNGHGTHVAGTIGAIGGNNLASAGIAWRVQIMPIKVFGSAGNGSVSDIARGIDYAVGHGAHIINASYGVFGTSNYSQTEFLAMSAAREAGIIFVAAAGNSAANMDVTRSYPASHALDNILTVGNSTRRDELSLSSNYGAAVDLFAPGSEIVSLNYAISTETTVLSGTSMAAPHVSGALALLKAQFPGDNYRQLMNRVLRGVDSGDRFLGKAQTGGRLNLLKALTTTTNRPFNDDFAGRPRLTTDSLAMRAHNQGATMETGEPAHATSGAVASIWWEWTAPTSGTVSVDTNGSAYDTLLAVYTGNQLAALTPVASNDDNGGTFASRVTFNAQAGATYEIAVAGKAGQSGLTLLNLGTTPANDAFAAAVVLSGASTHLTASNSSCSREPNEPFILGNLGGNSIWYKWTAPSTRRFQISAVSTDFDPLLGVFTGSAVDSLSAVAQSDNTGSGQTGSLCTVDAVAGTTYFIVVDSKSVASTGQFTLTLVDSIWQAVTGATIPGSPAVAPDGSIYIGSSDRYVYGLRADGTVKWTYLTGGLIDTCSPAIANDGALYIGSNDGKLYALSSTGVLRWARDFGAASPMSNSPALAADGTIYVKADDNYLYALNPTDGTMKWRYNVGSTQSYGSPSVAPDGTVYQGSEDKKLYALNPDGSLKWSYTSDNDIYTVPAIDAAGNLYFSVLNTGKLFSISSAGTLRWTYSGASVGSSSSATLSSDGSTVYYGGYDSKLHAVNTANGTARWVFPLGAEVRASSPAIDANGVVYIGCYDFKLYAVNPNGTLKRTYDTGGVVRSSPVISGNILYVGSNDNKLYAFDLGVGVAAGPWPQYRQNARRTGRVIAATSITQQPA